MGKKKENFIYFIKTRFYNELYHKTPSLNYRLNGSVDKKLFELILKVERIVQRFNFKLGVCKVCQNTSKIDS